MRRKPGDLATLQGSVHPDTELCRGCAGTGVRHDVGSRLLQAAKLPMTINFPPGAKRKRPVAVCIEPWSLTKVLAQIEFYVKLGGEPEGAFPLDMSHACDWCHGTGKPQLSVHALQIGIR